jgi:hypothetical protein
MKRQLATMNRANPMRLPISLMSLVPGSGAAKMIQFPRLIADFAALPSWRLLRWLPLLAVFAMMAAPPSADAATRRRAAGAYDGTWNVVFATTRGNCSSGYRVPFTVFGSRVSSAGGGRVSGAVNRAGAVAVRVSVGASRASGGGRLAGSYGAGSWSGIISGDRCSGTWQAARG